MKYQLLLLLMLLSFVKASAQVENKADYEPDFNDEPVLLSDVDNSKTGTVQKGHAQSTDKVKKPTTNNQYIAVEAPPPPPPVFFDSSDYYRPNTQDSKPLNMLGVEYGMPYEEAEKVLYAQFGEKDERSTEEMIIYGDFTKKMNLYNSGWETFALIFKSNEEGRSLSCGKMHSIFESKEECEENVHNFIDAIENEFNITMARYDQKKDDRDEVNVIYEGGINSETGNPGISINYMGENDVYMVFVTFFPPHSMVIENNIISPPTNKSNDHLKFMGFELNGTISDYHKKLLSKGIQISANNSSLPVGQRSYQGIFSGNDAEIVVWYNPRTKNVYRAKAIIKRKGKNLIQQLQSDIKAKLDAKYMSATKSQELVKDDYMHEFYQYSYSLPNGMIGLFITSTNYSNLNDFYLHIDYIDRENNLKSKIDEMDDL